MAVESDKEWTPQDNTPRNRAERRAQDKHFKRLARKVVKAQKRSSK